MKRFNKIYIEISNVCNLSCAFCPGTKRKPRIMSEDEFAFILARVKDYTDYVYFHLMGEPLCHPCLEKFIELAHSHGIRGIITTNGSLLKKHKDMLVSAKGLHKVNVSLHAFEANDLSVPFSEYLDGCFDFGKAAEGSKIIVYRLWNNGGADEKNNEIISALEKYFKKPWKENRNGFSIGDKVFLEHGDKFDWPSTDAKDYGEKAFCYGLKDQIGILADGSVVPCCLDHDGNIRLGNIFENSIKEILDMPKTKAIIEGFKCQIAAEELCRHCGYAHTKFR